MRFKHSTFTVLPFLLAMYVAVAGMGTSVYDIHARQVGALDVGHGATRSVSDLVTEQPTVMTRFLERLTFMATSEDGFIAAELLTPVAGIKALKQRAADIAKAMEKVQATVDDAAVTKEALVEANADLDKLIAMGAEINASIEREQKVASFRQSVAAVPDPDQTAADRAAGVAGIRVKDNREDDPKRGFKSHAEQMGAIIKAGVTGQVDERLRPLAAAGADEQGGHTNPHGAFLLAPAFAPDILSVQAEADPLAGRVRAVPMEADRVVFNARVDKNHTSSVSGGLTVSRTPETVAAATSRGEFEQVELVAHELVGAAYATNRILRTSPSSFIALLQSGFRDEFSAKLLDERLNGTGVGEFEGVVGADCTISVSKETGQKADTILFENVNKMRARCWRYGQAIWLANNDTYPQVSTLYMPIGTSGERVRIYEPGSEDAPEGRLLGRPIFFSEFCQKVGDNGDLVLGVWSEYLEGTRGEIEQSSSIHVRFLNREETFLFTVLNDAKPWWRSALTPKYSSETLSPFVTLAARA